jgi:hypothetical protein
MARRLDIATEILRMFPTISKKIMEDWEVTPCSPVGVHRRFRGAYCLQLQGQRGQKTTGRISEQSEWYRWWTAGLHGLSRSACYLHITHCWPGLVLGPERASIRCIPLKCHSVRSQKYSSWRLLWESQVQEVLIMLVFLYRMWNVNQTLNIGLLLERTRQRQMTSALRRVIKVCLVSFSVTNRISDKKERSGSQDT